jgi:UDP-N-acetylglucosamine 2-epimerase (non-hydrolysing)/UDP-GlcNAc3NAcA epimerase
VRLLTLVGNRPQFVKAAAVSRCLRERHEEVLVHSGQHYDDELSAVFFRELDLPPPDHELGVGSAGHDEQVTAIMHALEPVARDLAPDLVLVYGDTNTTLAGALGAARLDLRLAHVEAGMRSFDDSMPEERNRILTDHLSQLLLCSTAKALENLDAEGITAPARLVGDVMADVTLMMLPVAERSSDALERFVLESGSFLIVTVHRAGNVDERPQLERLVEILESLAQAAIFPVHPRTHARLDAFGLLARLRSVPGLTLTPPLGYLDFLKLLRHAHAVLTDSGGVQKEAYYLRTPCVTLRDETEWTETVEAGWNAVVGTDADRIVEAVKAVRAATDREHPDLYGDGHAAERIAAILEAPR